MGKNSTTTWTSKPDFRSSSFSTEFKLAIMGTQVQSSWADEIEDGDTNTLPLPSEKIVDNEKYEEKSAWDRLKDTKGGGVVKCRICKEDHWTTNCPYKEKVGLLKDLQMDAGDEKAGGSPAIGGPPTGVVATPGGTTKSGVYVPPSRRDGARGGESMNDRRRNEDTAAIRVSNLSESTQEADLQELFKPFGHIARIYLSKDKITGQCKGFAFVHYYKKDDAQKAISTLNGFGYDHLILNVEWAKPSGS